MTKNWFAALFLFFFFVFFFGNTALSTTLIYSNTGSYVSSATATINASNIALTKSFNTPGTYSGTLEIMKVYIKNNYGYGFYFHVCENSGKCVDTVPIGENENITDTLVSSDFFASYSTKINLDDLAEAKVTANIPQNIWDPDNQVYLYDPNFSVDVNVTSADVPILELYSDASSVSSDIGGSLRVLDFDLIAKNTTANFSGKAYPGARLFIAKKVFGADVLLKQGVPVSENGDFKISGIPADSLAYSILAKDKEGRQSQVKVYNRPSLYESLDISGILLSPTIDLVRGIVTRGDFIKVVGSAYPQSRVQIQLDNDILYETKASGGGEYHILINTARLSFGQHSVSAKEQDLATRKESDFSPTRTFLVSALAVVKADLNNDGKITITDWSIFLENWRRSKLGDTKATTIIDLNENGKADISDFGIFLRAFKTQYFFFHH